MFCQPGYCSWSISVEATKMKKWFNASHWGTFYGYLQHVFSWKNKILMLIIWASKQENLIWGFANSKGADQTTGMRSLIRAFVICLLESIIFKLATSKLPIFYLVSVAEQVGLNLTLSEASKIGFLAPQPIWNVILGCKNIIYSNR